jgi:hypothetical protein
LDTEDSTGRLHEFLVVMDLLGRLRGRESDSHIVSLMGDEEKIDKMPFKKECYLMPFRKELKPSNWLFL